MRARTINLEVNSIVSTATAYQRKAQRIREINS